MPVLAAYFASSGAYLLIETGDKKSEPYKFFKFPYRYIPAIYGYYYDEARFNADIVRLAASEMGKEVGDFDLLVAGKSDKPVISIEPKIYLSLDRIYQTAFGSNPVYVSNKLLHTKTEKIQVDTQIDSLSAWDNRYSSSAVNNEAEYLNNYDIYPQLSTIDLPTRLEFDRKIVHAFRKSGKITEGGGDLYFTGSKFSEVVLDPELDYVLMIDLINTPGIYKLYKDSNNAFILLTLLETFYSKRKTKPALENYVEQVGTLVKIPGPLECYVGSGEGTGQVFDIQKDDLLVLPIDRESVVDLSIKGPALARLVQRKVSGGRIGLIFCTMENDKLMTDDRKLLNASIKYFNFDGGRI